MLKQLEYGGYFFSEGVRHVLKIKRNIRYDNLLCLDDPHANLWLGEMVRSGKPFMAGRFGSGEMRTFLRTREVRMGLRRSVPETYMDSMCINAGFFPRQQERVMAFGDLMEESCRQVDLLAIWGTLPMENYVLHHHVPQAKRCYLSGLEPFFADRPWTMSWEGKKVLVIHPFEESIRLQYEQKEKFQRHMKWLPEFTLKTLKAVQTIGGQKDERFDTWFAALDYMYERAMEQEFDLAVIGCGAYGFPLAARLKQAGKQAVHMGGAVQLLFGITGKRWEAKEEYRLLMAEGWRRPLPSEMPEAAKNIEGGCYW